MSKKHRSPKSAHPADPDPSRRAQPGARVTKSADAGKGKGQWLVKVMTTTMPGTVIIIGIMLMAIGEKSGEYVVTGGVIAQFAGLAWKIRDVHRRAKERR